MMTSLLNNDNFGVTLILVKVIDLLWGFSPKPEAEGEGLDLSEHEEAAYAFEA